MKLKFVLFVLFFGFLTFSLQAKENSRNVLIGHSMSPNINHFIQNSKQPMEFPILKAKLEFIKKIVAKNVGLRSNKKRIGRGPASLDDNYEDAKKSLVEITYEDPELKIKYVPEVYKDCPKHFLDVSSNPKKIKLNYGIYIFWSEKNGKIIERKRFKIDSETFEVAF